MKVAITSVTLLLCVATAVGKPARPQDLPQCIKEGWLEFATKDEACSNKIVEIFQNKQVNDSYFRSLCASACAKEANDYFKEKCGVSLGEIFCSKDPRDQHYCFTSDKSVTTYKQIGLVLSGPCAYKDCSDPTCNTAVKNITCCAKEDKDSYLDLYGYFPIPPLPGNCVFPVECAKTERQDIKKILLQN
ncbi:uncharacterized protein LOC135349495 [Halichondria panicea]|uniref:uncharacterized protein LOC135349495 n=1 Tax=Halichondria panicea TaxID=6063 RepID=UPI00312BB2E3